MRDEYDFIHPSPLIPHPFGRGSSSVGRASAFQAECREFESRLPLHIFRICPSSSGVERILGKDEVASSNLALGFPKVFIDLYLVRLEK